MRRFALLVCIAVTSLLLAPPAQAKDEKKLPKAHKKEDVEKALDKLETDLKSDDMDETLTTLRWVGQHRHDLVIKELKKLYLRNKDLEIIGAAAKGLGNQVHNPKDAGKILMQGLGKYRKLAGKEVDSDEAKMIEDLEAKIIIHTVNGLGRLGDKKVWDKAWKDLARLIDHNNDDVAIAVIKLTGTKKEYRALPIIKNWFHHYPDGASWSGGTVRVDTGAAGNKDAKAAKAKWMGKYGSRAKKARPGAFKAMVEALKHITGVEIKKQEELKKWMEENKQLLKKHGV